MNPIDANKIDLPKETSGLSFAPKYTEPGSAAPTDIVKTIFNILSDPNPRDEIIERKKLKEHEFVYIQTSGWSFEGNVVDNLPNGICNLETPQGSYIGPYVNGKLNGEVSFHYKDESVYTGTFVDDVAHGKCTVDYADGTRFEGDIKNGKYNGHGTFRFKDGGIYEGEFRNGYPHGQGTHIMPNGVQIEGEFENGYFIKGKKTIPDAGIKEGHFQNGLLHGLGREIRNDGIVSEGLYLKGHLWGLGKMSEKVNIQGHTRDNVYVGSIVDNQRNGQGKQVYANGDIYEGQFFDNRITGIGTYKNPNGDRIRGIFKDGTMVSVIPESLPKKPRYETQSNANMIFTPSDIPQNDNDQKNDSFDYSKDIGNIVSDPNPGSEILERRTEGDLEFIHIVTKKRSYKGYLKDNKPMGYGVFKVHDYFCLEGEFDGDICLNAKKTYPSGQIQEGNFIQGNLTGPGKITIRNGFAIIEGFMLHGVCCGFVKASYSNGIIYLGNFIDSRREGFGTLKFSNGLTYKGPFVNNVRTGKGMMLDDDGWTYEGMFENDTYVNKGTGKITYKQKDIYEGEVSKGKANGKGVLKCLTGERFEGYFKDDQLHGLVTYTKPAEIVNEVEFTMLETQFEKGLPIEKSQGKLKFLNGDYYEGGLSYKTPHGQGAITYPNGDRYVGSFDMGKPHGRGIRFTKSGESYQGQFVNGKLEGQCKVKMKDGTTVTINFKNDVPLNAPSTNTVAQKKPSERELEDILAELCGSDDKKETNKSKGKNKKKSPPAIISPKPGDKQITNDAETCSVCFVEPKNTFFGPCGHKATCLDCGNKCGSCPICKTTKTSLTVMKSIHNDANCTICLKAPAPNDQLAALIPCGHFPFCNACIKTGEECPTCQKVVEAVQIIFNS